MSPNKNQTPAINKFHLLVGLFLTFLGFFDLITNTTSHILGIITVVVGLVIVLQGIYKLVR
jgi:hypothetical protein